MTHGSNRERFKKVDGRVQAGMTPRQAAKELGSVLYAFRLDGDIIKIGHTSDLDNRRSKLGAKWSDLLAIRPGTRAEEERLHRSLPDRHRAHSVEYYHPTPEIIALLNLWRHDLGLPPIPVKRAA